MVGTNQWPTDTGTDLFVGTQVHFCLSNGERHERVFGSVIGCSLSVNRRYVYKIFVSGKGMFYPVHPPEIMPCILGLPCFSDSMAGFTSSAVCTSSKNLQPPYVSGSRVQPARSASSPRSRPSVVRMSVVSTMPAPVIPQTRTCPRGPRLKQASGNSQLPPATPVTVACAAASPAPMDGVSAKVLPANTAQAAAAPPPPSRQPPPPPPPTTSSVITSKGPHPRFDKGRLAKSRKVSKNSATAKGTSSSGHKLCKHKIRLTSCRTCGGASICVHGLQRSWCKPCGGKARCNHGKQKSRCVLCGGVGICVHAKLRHRCKLCCGNK